MLTCPADATCASRTWPSLEQSGGAILRLELLCVTLDGKGTRGIPAGALPMSEMLLFDCQTYCYIHEGAAWPCKQCAAATSHALMAATVAHHFAYTSIACAVVRAATRPVETAMRDWCFLDGAFRVRHVNLSRCSILSMSQTC